MRCGYAARRQFDGIGGRKEYRGQGKRGNVLAKAHDLVAAVTKYHINGKLHKKHVDGLAVRNY